MSTLVNLIASQQALAALKCRFGCQSPVIGIFHAPEGCICWTDPVQALCAQHACSMESVGPITCIIDFSKWSDVQDRAIVAGLRRYHRGDPECLQARTREIRVTIEAALAALPGSPKKDVG